MNILKMVIFSMVDGFAAVLNSKQSAHNALRCELGSFKARVLFPLVALFPSLQQNKAAAKIRDGLWADVTPWFDECFSRSFKRLQQLTA